MKTKAKLCIFAFLSVVGLTIGFFYSGYIHLLLSGGTPELSRLHPAHIVSSLQENEQHRMLTLCIELAVVAVTGAFMLMTRMESFESDTSNITKSIKTPISVGQGQHGTARWMNRAEKKKAFSRYRIDRRDPAYAALLMEGKRDREVISNQKWLDEETTAEAVEGPCGPDTAAAAR